MRFLKFIALILSISVYSQGSNPKSWVYIDVKIGEEIQRVFGRTTRDQYKTVITGRHKRGFITLKEACKLKEKELVKVGTELYSDDASFKIVDVVQIGRLKGDPNNFPVNDIVAKGHKVDKNKLKPKPLLQKHFVIDLDNEVFFGIKDGETSKQIKSEFEALCRYNLTPGGITSYMYVANDDSHTFKFDKKNYLVSASLNGERGEISNGVKMGMTEDQVIEIMRDPAKRQDIPGKEGAQKLTYIFTRYSLYLNFEIEDNKSVLKQITVFFN